MKRWNNPWNLTPGQCAALDAVIEHKCDKAAAAALGLSSGTVSQQAAHARNKMNASNRLDTLLRWDRYRRTV